MYNKHADTVLSLQNVSKHYGSLKALDNVSLNLKRGEIYGLVGRNGSGKTTLIKMITGVASMTSGTLLLFQNPRPQQERYRLGTIIETPELFGYLTGRQNLEYFRRQRGFTDPNCVDKALKYSGLADKADVKVRKYSLGMRQRLGIALALLGDPEILILDEPVNGIDANGIVEIRHLLKRLSEQQGITILISSHILEELSHLAQRFGIIEKGQFISEVTAEELNSTSGVYLNLQVDNVQKASAVLEEQLGIYNYQVTGNQTLQIFEHLDNSSQISKAMYENDIQLFAMHVHRDSLEDFYLKQIGQVKEI